MEELHILVRSQNKIYKKPGDGIFGVCKNYKSKLEDYVFMILNEGTESFEKWVFVYWTKRKCYIYKIFWAYVYWFWWYTPNSGTIAENSETNVNANIQCYHVYACSSSK